ncbi:MAG: hypothetical protein NWR22_02470, partial [Saprospiraceae bacterium]|nr:hypothetical protein [Saprospiraceae bacterium]
MNAYLSNKGSSRIVIFFVSENEGFGGTANEEGFNMKNFPSGEFNRKEGPQDLGDSAHLTSL